MPQIITASKDSLSKGILQRDPTLISEKPFSDNEYFEDELIKSASISKPYKFLYPRSFS